MIRRFLKAIRALSLIDPEFEARLTDWPERLGPGAPDFIFTELRSRVREQVATMEQQGSKAFSIFGLQSLVLGAGGIFGDLQASKDAVGILSVIAIVTYVVATFFAAYVFGPSPRQPGVDPRVFTDPGWDGRSGDDVRDATPLT